MATDQEFHARRGQPAERSNGRFCVPDDDTAPHISQCDDGAVWTLDVYHDRHAKALAKMGCKALPSAHSEGSLFAVTAQQLIEFIAADAGLHVELRKRKRRTLTDEQKAELSQRMRRMNAERNGAVI